MNMIGKLVRNAEVRTLSNEKQVDRISNIKVLTSWHTI